MTIPYRLTLLTGWNLHHGQREIVLRSRKAQALITYLAVTKADADRQKISELLWSTDDPNRARTSLRQVLTGLNQSLKASVPQLIDTGLVLSLDHEHVQTDLDMLYQGIDAGLTDETARIDLRNLGSALTTLNGLTTDFDEWLRDVRQTMIANVQARLASVYSDAARPVDHQMTTAKEALWLDDLNEAAARALMVGHVKTGNSANALRVYNDLCERLDNDLDADPSPETQDLAVDIKLGKVHGTATVRSVRPPATPPPQEVTVAVMPFDVLGDATGHEYAALGLLDQITCHLAAYRAPSVISSNSTRGYLGQRPDMAQLQQDLNPSYVVSGSLLFAGVDVSIAVQLVEVTTGLVRWAGSFEVPADALFSIRTGLAENVARALMPNVDLAELRKVSSQPSETLGPYQLVLKAKDLMFQLDQGAIDASGALLAQAVATDPGFAPAHALMAEWYALRLWQHWSVDAAQDRQALTNHANRAVALSPGDGRSLALMAHCRMMFDARHAEALRLLDQAIELTPNDAETLSWSLPTLAFCDRAEQAVDYGKRALSLSPLDPFLFRNEHFLSIAQFMAGQFEDAAETGLSSHSRAPNYSSNIRMTIAALMCAGRRDEVPPLVTKHHRLEPDFTVTKLMQNHGLPDPEKRQSFARTLLDAGLPK